MQPYTPTGQCKKCGFRYATTRYRGATDDLLRICERCGHSWIEAPLDAKKGDASAS